MSSSKYNKVIPSYKPERYDILEMNDYADWCFNCFRTENAGARKNKELTQQELSDLSHVSVKQIANIENKGQHLSVQIFLELMSRYHISMEQILHGKATERMQFETLLDTRTDSVGRNWIWCDERYKQKIHGVFL